MSMSWREAIERVLTEEGRALHYSEISELILSKGYYKTEGATPRLFGCFQAKTH